MMQFIEGWTKMANRLTESSSRLSKALKGLSFGAALCGLIGLASANQSNTWSPTTGTVSGLQLTTNYNNAFSAIQSCNSGSTAPTNDQSGGPVKGQCWLNTGTTPRSVNIYDGTNWLIVGWMDDSNHIWIENNASGTNSISSATTTDLCSSGGSNVFNNVLTISGTTTINSFGSSCQTGAIKYVNFSGILTLTHNATNLILPNNGLNITTAIGDALIAEALGSGNWRVISYQTASGSALSANANITSSIAFTGVISPAALSAGNNNDYNPASLSTTETIRLTPNASGSTLTGLSGGSTGRQIVLANIGSGPVITLSSADTASLAANRFNIPSPYSLRQNDAITLRYDGTTSNWRIAGDAQGGTPLAAGQSYANLKIINDSGAPTTTIDITADFLVVRNFTTGDTMSVSNVSVSPTLTTSGANGLDTGSRPTGAITWLYAYVIVNPTAGGTVAGMYSLATSCSGVTMPANYTFCMRVGAVRTDAAAPGALMRQIQYGRTAQYTLVAASNTTVQPQIASGSTGSCTTPTWTAESVSNFVPTTAATIRLSLFVESGVTTSGCAAPNNNFGATNAVTNPPPLHLSALGGSTGGGGSVAGDFVLESTNVYYASNSASAVLMVLGWEDNL
jgi:hypothetical protein